MWYPTLMTKQLLIPKGNPPKKAVRLRYIRQLMALGKWETGRTGYELSEVWGLCESTVRKDAAEASHAIREAMVDTEGLRVEILTSLHEAKRRADLEENHGRAAMALIRALELQAKLTGAMAPERHTHQVTEPTNEPPPGWVFVSEDETEAHEKN